jgi:hypothetical protein
MRPLFYSLVASVLYVLAGAGFEWAFRTYFTGHFRFDASDVLTVVFPLLLPYDRLSRVVDWAPQNQGTALLVCWVSAFLVCFSFALWIRGLLRRKQRTAYLKRSACALLMFATLLIGWSSRDRIWLNLQMRSADQVRADCAKLLEKKRSMNIPRSGLPPSFAAIGAASAWVAHDSVRINFLKDDGFGSAWGFLYDPHQTYLTEMPKWPPVRNTLYRDFYEFRIEGE